MTFNVRLVQLMNVFYVTNKQLADACNVDPSLISRWRNGHRTPSEKYGQIRQIALFFLRLNKNLEQQKVIQEILALQKLHFPLLESQTDLLSSWLSAQQEITKQSLNPLMDAQKQAENEAFKMDKQTTKSLTRPHFPLTQQTKKDFHVFIGNNGKRKAALRFIQKAISLESPTDIYIFSDEMLQWWTEDSQFQLQWNSYLRLIIQNKHRIHLIHNLNRDKEEYVQYMNLWIPLHLIGHVNSHYYPVYVENPIKETKMIIRNTMALQSRSTFLTPKENICHLFEDSDTVNMIESLFLGRLVNCKPLIQAYKEQDHERFAQLYLENVKEKRSVIKIHQSFNSLFLPQSVFDKHCEHWSPSKKRSYLNFVKRWKNSVLEITQHKSWIDIIPYELLQQLSNNQAYSHFDPILFGQTFIPLSKEEIILTLKDMLYMLARHKHLNVYFSLRRYFKFPLNYSVEYRENHSAFFTSNYEQASPYVALFSNEPNLMLAYSSHLSNLLAEIPSSFKHKSESTLQIEAALKKLEA